MPNALILQEADQLRIAALKRRLRVQTRIEVVRAALALLEREADRLDKVERWREAAGRAAAESRVALRDFRPGSRLSQVD